MKKPINIFRLAISIGIVGAVVTPLWTGSMKRALPNARWLYFEDDRDRFIEQRGLEAWICLNLSTITNPDTRQTCVASESVPRSNSIVKTSLRWDRILPLVRDVVFGFIVPLIFVLLAPKAARAYLGWLTNSN